MLQVLKSAVDVGEFVSQVYFGAFDHSCQPRRTRCQVKLYRWKNPAKLAVVVVEATGEEFSPNMAVFLAVIDDDYFQSSTRKKRFSGSFVDYLAQLQGLLESCSLGCSKRSIQLAERDGCHRLEVVESGTFRPLAVFSAPIRKLDDEECLAVLKHELFRAEELLREKEAENSRVEAELARRKSEYSEEMRKLRSSEEELRREAEARQARVEEERRMTARRRESEQRQELEALAEQLETETSLVEKLEALEASLSRKTEVMALEKCELEDAVWFLKQQKETAEEAKRSGMKEEEVLREEIKTLVEQLGVNRKMNSDLDRQVTEWQAKVSAVGQQLTDMDADEEKLKAVLKKRAEVAQKISADLLASNRQISAAQEDCRRLLARINGLEAVVDSKDRCISGNQELIVEADRRLAKVEREKKLAIEASEAKAKEEKLAELEKQLKVNREVIAYMDKKLGEQSRPKSPKNDRFDLEKIYAFPRLRTS